MSHQVGCFLSDITGDFHEKQDVFRDSNKIQWLDREITLRCHQTWIPGKSNTELDELCDLKVMTSLEKHDYVVT